MRGLNKLIHAAALITILCVISCKKTDPIENTPSPDTNTNVLSNNYNPPAVTFSAPVQGFVTDGANNPVSGVEVKTGNKTATTDINGYFKIDNAPFTGDFCYLRASKKGFFTGSTTIHGKAGSDFAADLVIQPQQYIASFPAAQGNTVTLQGGSSVVFPANGFVTSTGAAYTGNVNIAVVHLNPEAKNFSSLIPGGDLRAFDANNQNVQLFSYGMLNVEMRDDAGNLLQLAKGKKATLTMPVPQTLLSNAPTTIPLWYFDDVKGIWIEEGSATMQGNNYVGTVAHFTAWNWDQPFPPSIIKGKVVDDAENPVQHIVLKVNQTYVTTDSKGEFKVLVIAGSDVTIDYLDKINETFFGVNIKAKAPQENETLDLGKIVFSAGTQITTTVKNCDGSVFTGYALLRFGNLNKNLPISNSKCTFNISTLGVGDAELIFFSSDLVNQQSKKFTVPTTPSKKDLGEVFVCAGNNLIEYFSFTYQKIGGEPVRVRIFTPALSFYEYKIPDKLSWIEMTNGIDTPQGMSIRVHSENKPGTYTITSQDPSSSFYYSGVDENNTSIILLSNNMTITFTEFRERFGGAWNLVSGTFSGTAKLGSEDVVITNGSFRTKGL